MDSKGIDNRIALLIERAQPSVLKDYLDQVANKALLTYRNEEHLQWGAKKGESLYTHVLNGVFVLDSLCDLLNLPEIEASILLTAYTVHDLNKFPGREGSFNKLAVADNVAQEIERLGLPAFFPGWRDYLEDITSLVRSHGGSTHTSGELLVAKRAPVYRLGRERILALRYLMKAADIIDLSHTLEERRHKETFLGHLNAYLAEAGEARQYTFVTHRLTEQRGLLSNVLHGAISGELEESHGLVPLLFYPDGIAYLAERGADLSIRVDERQRMGRRAAQSINRMTRGRYRSFIKSTGQGIKVDAKCLELSVPFDGKDGILEEIYNLVQRRSLDPERLEEKARERAERNFEKNKEAAPVAAEAVRAALESDQPLVPREDARLRVAELARTYYIFLNTHFDQQVPNPWQRVYRLLDLPEGHWTFYEYFDARYDRAYVLAEDLVLDEEAIYRRIAEDGTTLLEAEAGDADPKVKLFGDYLSRYAVFSVSGQPQTGFQDHLEQYVTSQHKQCVHCSSPFPTDKWMAGDVRDDITVQTFSNRLRGGPGDPKKYVCAICQIQFLLEKLNYPRIRGEALLYLHLFPYSFLTRPFVEALRNTFRRITETGSAVNALNLEAPEALRQWLEGETQKPYFRTQTKKGKPQPYGVYVPRYSETTGNLLILPINPAGANDSEKFLFALWNTLVLQRHFGVKVLLSGASAPPLDKENFGDVYVDSIPLAARGLLPRNDYRQFDPETNEPGALPQLWDKVQQLFQLRRLTFTSADNTPRLVRALAVHPLAIFHETDRLLEARGKKETGGLGTWLYQQAMTPVETLAIHQGGDFMTKLSEELNRLARIAWEEGLRGRSLERSSLLFPFNEVMQKMAQTQSSKEVDVETLKAAATQDIFDHLERLARQRGYNIGRKKLNAATAFVDGWFEDVLGGVYEGRTRKLLADEKLLRSAFLFYVRSQISPKEKDERAAEETAIAA